MVDYDNVGIMYLLQPMTSLWRHICKRLSIRTSRQNTALFHSIIQRLIINNQQEYYLVTDELKCQLVLKICAFLCGFVCMSHLQHSVAVTLSCISGDRTKSGLWMKSCLMLNCLKFHHIIHDTATSVHQQVPCTHKKWDPGLMAYRVL